MLTFLHGGGRIPNLHHESTSLVSYDTNLSQNISTMSQSWTNVMQALADTLARQQQILETGFSGLQRHNMLVQRGFDRLIECLSHTHSNSVLESDSGIVE